MSLETRILRICFQVSQRRGIVGWPHVSDSLLLFSYTISDCLLLILNGDLLFHLFLLLCCSDLSDFVRVQLIIFGDIVFHVVMLSDLGMRRLLLSLVVQGLQTG